MKTIDEMINQVLAGNSTHQVLESVLEADVPSWKPGEPVPKGYHVVFGKLAKLGTMSPSSARKHVAATKAWSLTASAKTPKDHETASDAHQKAAELHTNLGGNADDKDKEVAALHRKQVGYHASKSS